MNRSSGLPSQSTWFDDLKGKNKNTMKENVLIHMKYRIVSHFLVSVH